MSKKAKVHYRSLRSNLIHLPLSVYSGLVQSGTRPQSLIVHLTLIRGDKHGPLSSTKASSQAYLGWSGLSSASSLSFHQTTTTTRNSTSPVNLETVEIDPEVSRGLGWPEGSIVEIAIIHNPKRAKSVSVTPLTSDDWEVLELHTNYLEQNLLSQLRAASANPDHPLSVWAGGKTRIGLTVDETNPPTKSNTAVLITPDTEIFVAPRPRHKTRASKSIEDGGNVKPAADNKAAKPMASIKQATSIPTQHDQSTRASTSTVAPVKPNSSAVEQTATTSPLPSKTVVSSTSYCLRTIPPRIFTQWPDVVQALDHEITSSNLQVDQDASRRALGCEKRWILWGNKRTLALVRKRAHLDMSTTQPNDDEDRELVEILPFNTTTSPSPDDPTHSTGDQQQPSSTTDDTDPTASGIATAPKKRRAVYRVLQGIPDGHVILWPSWGGDGDVDPGWKVQDWQSVQLEVTERDKVKSKSKPKLIPPLQQGLEKSQDTAAPPLAPLAGVDKILAKTLSYLSCSTMLSTRKALLLTAGNGMGKTSIAHHISRRLEVDKRMLLQTKYIDCKAANIPGSLKGMRQVIDDWLKIDGLTDRALLVLDNLHSVARTEVEQGDNTLTRATAEYLVSSLSAVARRGVYVVATSTSAMDLHPLLRTMHLFGETVELKSMDAVARQEIFRALVYARMSSAPTSPDHLDYVTLSHMAEGYTSADIRDLVDNAMQNMLIRLMEGANPSDPDSASPRLLLQDFTKAAEDFKPRSLREVKLQTSSVAWSDIGGLHETRRVLRETLEWPTKYGAIFAKCPLRLRSGLLLYGYPGCGKTLLASAVAKECGLHFISVKGPELLNKYIGASEKSVRDIFARAVAAKPCVLFFDEFDSLAPKRGHDSTGVTDRIVNQLLTEMDGAEGLDGVYVLAATSRPDLIDGALLRPGRLDKSLLCNMPDESERLDILRALSRKLDMNPDVDLVPLAHSTAAFSGADLQSLISNAQLEAIHELLDRPEHASTLDQQRQQPGLAVKSLRVWEASGDAGEKILNQSQKSDLMREVEPVLANLANDNPTSEAIPTTESQPKPRIGTRHLEQALTKTRPSVPEREKLRLSRIYNTFVQGSADPLPDGSAPNGVGQRASLM